MKKPITEIISEVEDLILSVEVLWNKLSAEEQREWEEYKAILKGNL